MIFKSIKNFFTVSSEAGIKLNEILSNTKWELGVCGIKSLKYQIDIIFDDIYLHNNEKSLLSIYPLPLRYVESMILRRRINSIYTDLHKQKRAAEIEKILS